MAALLMGKVYYNEHFAGYLREEPGDRTSFTYDDHYLNITLPPISHTLPLRSEPFTTQAGLHPFFDNLAAEGWLEGAQTRFLGKRQATRFELLLTFGQDCAGAVSVVDPEPTKLVQTLANNLDPIEMAVMSNRASLSGVQPKLPVVERDGKFYPTKMGEVSTHIAKFPSREHDDLVMIEYYTMHAYSAVLLTDSIVDLWIGEVEGFPEQALIIKRFDREVGGKRIHFEEFNQLLGHPSRAKYDGAYKDMADFIWETKECLPAEVYRLYLRILAGLLLGNTDMHLKNFAMLHTSDGLRLTPSYDQVAAAIYPSYKTVALAIGDAHNLEIGTLKPRNIITLGKEFRLPSGAIKMAYEHLLKSRDLAKDTIEAARFLTPVTKNQIIKMMERRWNGTFALIGQTLSTKL